MCMAGRYAAQYHALSVAVNMLNTRHSLRWVRHMAVVALVLDAFNLVMESLG